MKSAIDRAEQAGRSTAAPPRQSVPDQDRHEVDFSEYGADRLAGGSPGGTVDRSQERGVTHGPAVVRIDEIDLVQRLGAAVVAGPRRPSVHGAQDRPSTDHHRNSGADGLHSLEIRLHQWRWL